MEADGQVDVAQIGDEAAADWDAWVTAAPAASIYHRYRWRHIVRKVFARETFYLAARRQGHLCGILPIVRLKSRLFGDFLVSVPYFNYGGVVGESGEVEQRLVDQACELARALGVSHLELRHRTGASASLPARTDKVTLLLDLPSSPAALLKSLDSKVRAQIKRPQREGATCRRGGAELLPDFYTVFAENMRDLGTPVYPKSFFAEMLAAFPTEASLFAVYLGGAPVAAGFVLGARGVLEIPWASSLRRANSVGVNMLLYWSILEFACQSGYSRFDFGRCTVDSGTYRFKRQWGAQPEQLYWHYWMREAGELPRINHSSPKFEAAIAAWRRLPLPIANRLGPLLVRNLP